MDINQPELELFKKNYIAGKNQLLFHTFAADVHTPVSALIKLKEEDYILEQSKNHLNLTVMQQFKELQYVMIYLIVIETVRTLFKNIFFLEDFCLLLIK